MNVERTKVDLLLRHGRVLTVDAERRILVDGTIAIRDGRIVDIGTDREVAPGVEAATVRDLGGALVHPGFVNAHVHIGGALVRGLLPEGSRDARAVDLPFTASKTPKDEYLGALLTCMEMVATGTTLYGETGGVLFLESAVQATEVVGMRGIPGYLLADIPTGFFQGQESVAPTGANRYYTPTGECLKRLADQMERYPFHGGGRVKCAVTVNGMGTATDHLLIQAKSLADQAHVPMIMHQSWLAEEVPKSVARYGKRPVAHLADLGILGSNLTLVHMIQIDEHESALVAESGTCVVHCPNASIRYGKGAIRLGRFPEMLKAGVPIGLGSDGYGGRSDVSRQAYLAATLFREIRDEVPLITAQMALEMATIHGARALGMQDEVGSLETGKRADLVIHTLDRPESHPRHQDPVSTLIYYCLSRTVDTVMVDGEIILDGGHFTRFDAREAYAEIDAAAAVWGAQIDVRGSDWPLIK